MSNHLQHPETSRFEVPNPAIYKGGIKIVSLVAQLCGGISWSGEENLPDKDSFILAANHSSAFDPLILGSAIFKITNDQTHFLATDELWQKQIKAGDKTVRLGILRHPLGALLDACGVIAITRNKPLTRDNLTRLDEMMKHNGIIGIFPEGGLRHGHQIGDIHIGTGMLAARYGLDVVPTGIAGSDPLIQDNGFRDFGKFHVHFGESIPVPRNRQTVKVGRQITPQIQAGIQLAVDTAYNIRNTD